MNLILWRQIVHDGKGAGHRKGIVNQNGVISRCGVIAVRHVVTGYGIIIEYGMVAKHRVNFFGGDGSGRKRQRVPVIITVDGHALDGIGRTKRRSIRHPKEAARHHHEPRAWRNERQERSAACSFPGLPSKTPPSHRDAAHEEPRRRPASRWRSIERRPKRQPSHRDESKKEPYGEAPCRHRRHASTRPSRPGQRQRTRRFESRYRTKQPRARASEEPTLLQSELRALILPAASLSPLS